MIHSIRKLLLVLSWAICFSSPSNAQQVDTTGNLINNGVDYSGQTGWSGIGGYSQLGGVHPSELWGCCTSYSGAAPFLDAATWGGNGDSGQIIWSYGQSTVGQSRSVPNIFGSTGIQVTGYSWGYDIRNMNGLAGTSQSGVDSITATSYLTSSSGQTLISESHTYNTMFDWTRFTGYQTLPAPVSASSLGVVGINFTASDSGFWAGYYGPQVRNVDLRLNYMVDQCALDPLSSSSCPGFAEAFKAQQCALNPLYDQTCPGYSAVILSDNLVPNPGGQTGFFGGFLNNSFAINTALSHSGAGLMVHGFQWGYRATNYSVFGSAVGESTVNVNIRNGDGSSLYAWSRNNTRAGENRYSASYVLPQSINNLNMGNFEFTASSSGFGIVDRMWAKAFITPDSCTADPLSSPLCSKYEEAFLAQQCAIYTLYSSQCPGYAEALQALLDEQAALAAAATTSTTTTTQDTTNTTGSTDGTVLSSSSDTTSSPAAVTTDAGGVDVSATGEIKAQDGVPEVVKETKTAEKTTDEKVAVETTNKTEKEKKTLSTSQLLAIANRAINEANSIAKSVTETSIEKSQSENANPSDGTGTTVSLGGGISIDVLATNNISPLSSSINLTNVETNLTNITNTSINENQKITIKEDTTNEKQSEQIVKIENKVETITSFISETKTIENKEQKQTNRSSVRNGGKVEGMEGGPDVSQLAQVPADFNSYLSAQLRDAQFYQSKDIYRGQKNVDNARLLRGLTSGSDRKYEEMINEQYR